MEEVAEAANEEALSAAVNNLRLSPLYDAEVCQYFEAHWLDSKQVGYVQFTLFLNALYKVLQLQCMDIVTDAYTAQLT